MFLNKQYLPQTPKFEVDWTPKFEVDWTPKTLWDEECYFEKKIVFKYTVLVHSECKLCGEADGLTESAILSALYCLSVNENFQKENYPKLCKETQNTLRSNSWNKHADSLALYGVFLLKSVLKICIKRYVDMEWTLENDFVMAQAAIRYVLKMTDRKIDILGVAKNEDGTPPNIVLPGVMTEELKSIVYPAGGGEEGIEDGGEIKTPTHALHFILGIIKNIHRVLDIKDLEVDKFSVINDDDDDDDDDDQLSVDSISNWANNNFENDVVTFVPKEESKKNTSPVVNQVNQFNLDENSDDSNKPLPSPPPALTPIKNNDDKGVVVRKQPTITPITFTKNPNNNGILPSPNDDDDDDDTENDEVPENDEVSEDDEVPEDDEVSEGNESGDKGREISEISEISDNGEDDYEVSDDDD